MHRNSSAKASVLLAAIAVITVACQSADDPTAGTEPVDAADEREPTGDRLPMDQQEIVIAMGPDEYPVGEDEEPSLGKYPVNTSVFDTLVRMNEEHQVEPMLAESWEHDVDTNTYTFHLREGVKFHDGEALTAHDVKYTFDLRAEARENMYQRVDEDSTEIIDDYTVAVTPSERNNRLVEQITHPHWGINREGSFEEDHLAPVGTGPYQFAEYVENDRFVVERFGDYWNPDGEAQANRIELQFVDDPQSKMLALQGGDIDMMIDVPRDITDQIEGQAGLGIERSPVGAYIDLHFNMHGEGDWHHTSDPAVREAIFAGIDRQEVIDVAWGGNAEVVDTWVPPSVLGEHADAIEGPSYDPERARQLLEDAGWTEGEDGIRTKDGERLNLDHVVSAPTADHMPAPELIQDQLRDIGVETNIHLMPDRASGSERQSAGEFSMQQGMGNQNDANPCFLPDLLYYRGVDPQGASLWRAPGGATDEVLDQCRSAADIDSVRQHTAEAVRHLVDEEFVVFPLAGIYRIWGVNDNVAGFDPHPSFTNQRLEGLYLVEG